LSFSVVLAFDAGMDIFANEDVIIKTKSWGLVKTGIAMELPDGFEAQVRSRSGLAVKNGVFVLNSPGTIDAGFRGEIGVILCNLGESDFKVVKGSRIAQLVVSKLTEFEYNEKDTLSNSDRGEKGFGSSGI